MPELQQECKSWVEFFTNTESTLCLLPSVPPSPHILRYVRILYDKVSTIFKTAGDVLKDCHSGHPRQSKTIKKRGKNDGERFGQKFYTLGTVATTKLEIAANKNTSLS
jgi:hypothetical protein